MSLNIQKLSCEDRAKLKIELEREELRVAEEAAEIAIADKRKLDAAKRVETVLVEIRCRSGLMSRCHIPVEGIVKLGVFGILFGNGPTVADEMSKSTYTPDSSNSSLDSISAMKTTDANIWPSGTTYISSTSTASTSTASYDKFSDGSGLLDGTGWIIDE